MSKYKQNRFLPMLLIIVIVIIAIAAIVSLARSMFFSGTDDGSEEPTTGQVDESREQLLDTESGNSVQTTVRGEIVGDEEFHSYRITISPSTRTLVTYQGYLGNEVDRINLSNNRQAYDEFVHALDKANMVVGEAFEGEDDDTRGICAHGRLYEYETLQSGESTKRLWTTTCSGSPGSLYANSDQLTRLFVDQIPDARPLLREVSL